MKINWGVAITICIISFMSFILYLVVQVSNTNTSLQAEDYYQQEVSYQTEIDAQQNFKHLNQVLEINQSQDSIQFVLPDFFQHLTTPIEVMFLRPNNQLLDKEISISPASGRLRLAKNELSAGLYTIKINWFFQGLSYQVKQNYTIE